MISIKVFHLGSPLRSEIDLEIRRYVFKIVRPASWISRPTVELETVVRGVMEDAWRGSNDI